MPIPTFQFTEPKFPTTPTPITPITPINPLLASKPSLLFDFFTKKNLLNQKEIFSNTTQNVGFVDASFQAMLKSVGWKEASKTKTGKIIDGEAWCAYFVKLCFMQLYSFDRKFLSKNLTGSAIGNLEKIQELNSKGNKTWIASTKNDPQVGDAFSLKMTKGGHTGIIIEVVNQNLDGSWSVKTAEGNTNAGASREGDKSMTLSRALKVGSRTGGGILLGYYRRNFTEEEKNKLKFDDKNQTFIFE